MDKIPQESVADLHHQINNRIFDRNIPSAPLQPYLSVYPVDTKHTVLPIIDQRKQSSIQLPQYPSFNIHKTFNPGTTKSPFSGFAANINIESELKNQIFALQKNDQAVYVPNSSSDLFNYKIRSKRVKNTQ